MLDRRAVALSMYRAGLVDAPFRGPIDADHRIRHTQPRPRDALASRQRRIMPPPIIAPAAELILQPIYLRKSYDLRLL